MERFDVFLFKNKKNALIKFYYFLNVLNNKHVEKTTETLK